MANFAITTFVTAAGFDVVLQDMRFEQPRRVDTARLDLINPVGVLNQKPVKLIVGESDDQLFVEYGDSKGVLRLQPKGHYFGGLRTLEPSTPLTLAEVRALIKAKAAPTAEPPTETKPKTKSKNKPAVNNDLTDDEIPF